MVLKLRSVLDPKRHYKTKDAKKIPKYFQIGHVVPGPTEYYGPDGARNGKSKQSLVDQLLEDTSFRQYNKSKFLQIQQVGGNLVCRLYFLVTNRSLYHCVGA